jgi:hypothetical protein
MFIDETGLDRSIKIRRKDWAPREKRPRQIKWFHRNARFQILPVYTQDDVIHFRVYEESTDTRVFEDFIKELLLYCGKWSNPRSVLIMNNASFHHLEKIQRLCDDAGVILHYLPSYSPDLNPIEEFFGELKTYIRQVWNEYKGFIKTDFLSFLKECITVVGGWEISIKSHFRHVEISINKSLEWDVIYIMRSVGICAVRLIQIQSRVLYSVLLRTTILISYVYHTVVPYMCVARSSLSLQKMQV